MLANSVQGQIHIQRNKLRELFYACVLVHSTGFGVSFIFRLLKLVYVAILTPKCDTPQNVLARKTNFSTTTTEKEHKIAHK